MSGNFVITADTAGITRLKTEAPGKLARRLDVVAEDVVNDIVRGFNTSPPGARYDRGTRGVHVASQPGYPPNVDTGQLRASIRWERDGSLTRKVMDGVEYGLHLEIGTTEMAARPFFGPVFEDWSRGKRFENAFKDLL